MEEGGWKISGILNEKNLAQSIKHQKLSPLSLIQIYDSIYHWQWDTTSMDWVIASKTISIVYDVNHNLLSYIGQTLNGSAWVNSWQWIYTYDANNNLTSRLSQGWNGAPG